MVQGTSIMNAGNNPPPHDQREPNDYGNLSGSYAEPATNTCLSCADVTLRLATCAAAMFLVFSYASAQATEPEEGPPSSQPAALSWDDNSKFEQVISIDRQEIDLTKAGSLEEALRNLPEITISDSQFRNNGGAGITEIDLFQLGVTRSLVVVDGRRLGSANNSVDIDQVPDFLIDHVDLTTADHSAAYGSGAMGGVVNFVLQRSFTGFAVGATVGFDEHDNDDRAAQLRLRAAGFDRPSGDISDGETVDVYIRAGTDLSGSRGNVQGYFEYSRRNAVYDRDRDWDACAVTSGGPKGGDLACGGSPTTYPGHFLNLLADDPDYALRSGGALAPFSASDQFNYQSYTALSRPDLRVRLGAMIHYSIGGAATFYGTFMFTRDKSQEISAPGGLFYDDVYAINCDNPLLSPNEIDRFCIDADVGPTDDTYLEIGRRNVEGGPRIIANRHSLFHADIGIRGKMSDLVSYDVFAEANYDDETTEEHNELSYTRVQNALEVVTGPSGAPICKSVLDGSDPSCVPYNIFFPGQVSPSALAYVSTRGRSVEEPHEKEIGATLNFDFGAIGLRLPFTSSGVRLSIGIEHRNESDSLKPANGLESGDFSDGSVETPVRGHYDTLDEFAELQVPLISGLPLAQDLSIKAGFRHVDDSASGGAESWDIGGVWSPVDGFTIRGSFGRGFNEPNVGVLFATQSKGPFYYLFDPCAGTSPSASLQACAATGVGLGQYGLIPQCGPFNCNALFGGNPDLNFEMNHSWTVGTLLAPKFLPGFEMSVDWHRIQIVNSFAYINTFGILSGCYDSGIAALCALLHRDPTTNSLEDAGYISSTALNSLTFEQSGFDVEAIYRIDASDLGFSSLGKFSFLFRGAYVNRADATFIDRTHFACAGVYGPDCIPMPRWRHNMRAEWLTPWPLIVALDWRHRSGMKLEQTSASAATTDARIPAVDYFDVSGTWHVNDLVKVDIGVSNVFDRNPPLTPIATEHNTFPELYDVLGREIFLRVEARY